MTDAEKSALLAAHPGCWFVRVQKAGTECIVAIPKREDAEIKMPGGAVWPVAMLHGATVRL